MDTSYVLEFSHGTATLNEEQYKVVTSPVTENQRILASAGSGKTTTITARIAYLVEEYGIDPTEILLVTFSRAAADEMIHRVERLLGTEATAPLYAGTFHSLANQILRTHAPSLLRDQPFVDELPYRFAEWLQTTPGKSFASSFRCIIVDEFQDINAIQWELLMGCYRAPSTSSIHITRTMTIVGDDAQNIYTWRGSSVDFILQFHTYLNHVVDYQLCRNYRSMESIVNVANSVMRYIPTLPFKEQMTAYARGGRKPEVHYFFRSADECDWIVHSVERLVTTYPTCTVAVLSRYNSDLYKIEERLHLKRMAYHMVRRNKHMTTDSEEEEGQTAMSRITLATLHGSKGLEWDIVFFMNLHDDVFPSRKSEEEVICERRLFYVGVTRAKKGLFMTYSRQEKSLSRFVREIPRPLLRYHNVATFLLSTTEAPLGAPRLEDVFQSMEGGDWNRLRKQHAVPAITAMEQDATYPFGTFFQTPRWVERLGVHDTWTEWLRWMALRECALYQGKLEQLCTPTIRTTLLTLRIYREDIEFWEQYAVELEHLAEHFLIQRPNMPMIEFGKMDTYVRNKMPHLTWTNKETCQAAVILAKLRGQLRPLLTVFHDPNQLIRFFHHCSFGYVRHAVPTELRGLGIQSWYAILDPTRKTHTLLVDLWRMAALSSVAHGRTLPLHQLSTIAPLLQTDMIRKMAEHMEQSLPVWMAAQGRMNFHVAFDVPNIQPITFDLLSDRCAYQLFFDPIFVPTMEDKILLVLKQYLYEEVYDRYMEHIGFLNLATGMALHYRITPAIREQLTHLWQYMITTHVPPNQPPTLPLPVVAPLE